MIAATIGLFADSGDESEIVINHKGQAIRVLLLAPSALDEETSAELAGQKLDLGTDGKPKFTAPSAAKKLAHLVVRLACHPDTRAPLFGREHVQSILEARRGSLFYALSAAVQKWVAGARDAGNDSGGDAKPETSPEPA